MPRHSSNDTAIGQRIRERRKLLGYSIRYAADRAGLAHTTLSRIERGEMSADNRFVLAEVADALRCPVGDLTGQPADPVDRDQAETGGRIYDTIKAIIDADLTYEPTTPAAQPIGELQRELDLTRHLYSRCDYAGAAGRLPDLVRGLHAAAFTTDRAVALRGLVAAEDTASFVVRYAGHPASACLVADRAQQAAEASEQPVLLGLAAYVRAHAASGCGLYQRTLTITEHAIGDLQPHAQLPEAAEVLGQLHLTHAFALYALGRHDDAHGPLAHAQRIAERTGDTTTLGLMFGPSNVNFWRIAMEADGPDPGKAVEIARHTDPQAVAMPSRQAAFYLDTGRALAHTGNDQAAVRTLLAAERIAPQRLRGPLAVETARGLLERARRGAGWTELRGLCQRIGVGV